MDRFIVAIVFAILATPSPSGIPARRTSRPPDRQRDRPSSVKLSDEYRNLPLFFEPNVGQTDPRVRFLTRGSGLTTFFTDTETVLVLARNPERAVVRMKLAGMGRPRQAAGLEKLPGVSHYFLGNDPAKWRTNVPHYARVRYEGVYPGIDMVWYGNQRRLEYDFVVAPAADPNVIQVVYEGVESLRTNADGELVLQTTLGEVRQQKPKVYQEIGGKRVEVQARYAIAPPNRVGFQLARYDRNRELHIDPVVLVYSTYLGGTGSDTAVRIAVDGAGAAYITGVTTSTDFPTQSPYQTTRQGTTYQSAVFVTKLTPTGNALTYSTYLGGTGAHAVAGIAVDSSGSAYVAGQTNASNFPTQSAFQGTHGGGGQDGFVTKLAPSGNALVYSTYLGGGGADMAGGIALDSARSAYVVGTTSSVNFPTRSPYQATNRGSGDAFVTKFTPAGNALVYSTFIGGSDGEEGSGIAVDREGSAYITGRTQSMNFPTQSAYQPTRLGPGPHIGFVTKFTPTGSALGYSTYLGGGGEWLAGIAVDSAGSAYVAGSTFWSNFPTVTPFQAASGGGMDVFVTKLTPAGNGLVYSTYLGGNGLDMAGGIALDGAGSAYVIGLTTSSNFPTQSPYQERVDEFSTDAFVTKLTPGGNGLAYSTYLRGGGEDGGSGIAVDAAGAAFIVGQTQSVDFPTRSSYQEALREVSDAFVAKIQLAGDPQVAAGGVANAASYVAGKVSPGEIVVIFGKDFGPATLAGLQLASGMVATEIGETRVLFDDVAAPMVYAVSGQISCVAPYEIAGKTTTQMLVEYKKVKGAALTVPVVEAAPGLFTSNASGKGPGAFLNEDNSPNTPGNPVERGKIAILYGTGEGQTTPAGVSGLPATAAFPKPLLPVTVTIGGKNAEVLYAGAAPYMVAGVLQINARVPVDIPAGNAEVVIRVGNNASQTGVTLAVK